MIEPALRAAREHTTAQPAASAPATPPRRRDPEARRREILVAAAALAAEQGPAALTHRAIAARAGVPLGSTTQHFASLEELREAALQLMADEIDASLRGIEPFVAEIAHDPTDAVTEILAFLDDRHAVRSDIALIATGTTDPRLRSLAVRWNERLIEMLQVHVGTERAVAISVFLDGVTIHAGLNDQPLSRDALTRALLALAQLPLPPEAEASDARDSTGRPDRATHPIRQNLGSEAQSPASRRTA